MDGNAAFATEQPTSKKQIQDATDYLNVYGGMQFSRADEYDSKLATPQKKDYDVDKAQVSVDENQEEINTPRDDNLLTDGDILGSPIEFDQHINNNYNNEF